MATLKCDKCGKDYTCNEAKCPKPCRCSKTMVWKVSERYVCATCYGTSVRKRASSLISEEPDFGDITFYKGDKEVSTFRCVLEVHSEYFRNLFNSNMKDSNERRLAIDDKVSFDAFKGFLEVTITGGPVLTTIRTDYICEIYYLADLYAMEDLRDFILLTMVPRPEFVLGILIKLYLLGLTGHTIYKAQAGCAAKHIKKIMSHKSAEVLAKFPTVMFDIMSEFAGKA